MTLYAMKKQLRREQTNTIRVPTARPGTLGEHLSGLTLLVVSEEQAERNRQIEAGRQLAAKEAREELEAKTRARIAAEQAAMAPAVISEKPMTNVVEAPQVRVVHTPTPEETAALRADIDRREATLLKTGRRADALADKGRLLAWANNTKPSISAFVEALLETGFVYSHDDRNAAVYTYQEVEIRAFGAAMNPEQKGGRFDKRLSTEQAKALARRHTPGAATTAPKAITVVTTDTATAVKTPEERAQEKEKHIRIAAEQQAVKKAKQAAYKAAHPKVKSIKIPKKEQQSDKSGKGGKNQSRDKK